MRNQVAFRKLTYVGKILRRERSHIPMRFLSAWYDNPRKQGGQLLMNKDSLVRNIRLIIPVVDDVRSVSVLVTGHSKTSSQKKRRVTPRTNRKPIKTYPTPPQTPPPSQPPHFPSRSGRALSGSQGFGGLRPFKSPPP